MKKRGILLGVQLGCLIPILLAGTLAFSKTPGCTPHVRRIMNALPGLGVSKCTSDISSYGKQRTSELWKRTIQGYEEELALWGEQAWSVPAGALTACDADVQRSGSLLMVITSDPCLTDGSATSPYNAFLLVRNPEQKIVITEIVDGGYRSMDTTPELKQITDPGDQSLILFDQRGEEFYQEYETLTAFRLNPKTSRPEPAQIFPVREVHPATSSKNIVTSGHTAELAPRWIQKGKLAGQFDILEESTEESGGYSRVTYRWNGKAYIVVAVKHEASAEAKAIADYRACLKANFSTGKACDEPDDVNITCEKQNDLAWLNFKANKLQDALNYAQPALESCKDKPLELKHADYNYKRIQKALQAAKR
jgi:hypothetical protein